MLCALPLPAPRQRRRALRQRGERVGVRGGRSLRRVLLPLTLTLSPCLKRHGERG